MRLRRAVAWSWMGVAGLTLVIVALLVRWRTIQRRAESPGRSLLASIQAGTPGLGTTTK
jgi:hypothetical protein